MQIWQGVYQKLSEVPVVGSGFGSQRWLNSLNRDLQSQTPPPRLITRKRGWLVPFVGVIYSLSPEMRIVDFGGGIGGSYQELKQCLPDFKPDRYAVVEGGEACSLGKRYWGLTGPRFYEDLGDVPGGGDVLFLGSSLHYVDPWKEVLKKLAGLNPRVILIEDVPTSLGPTFATGQTYYESVIPAWFFNEEELVQWVQSLGYIRLHSEDFYALKTRDGVPLVIEGAQIHTHTRSHVFLSQQHA